MTNRLRKQKGIALFIAILMSISVALLASASALKAQQISRIASTHQNRVQLRLFATEAARFALANIQAQINVETATVLDSYTIEGPSAGNFIFYPNQPSGPKRPLFAYRSLAILVGSPGETLPGMSSPLAAGHFCFDIVADARQVIELSPDAFVQAGMHITGNLYWGKSKSIGMIACIPRQLNP